MIKFLRKYNREVVFSAVIIMCVFLICAALVLINAYSDDLDEQAKTRVESYSADTTYRLNQRIEAYNLRTNHIAELLAKCQSRDDVIDTFIDVRALPEYSDAIAVRFFNDGVEYDSYGGHFLGVESERVLETVGKTGTFSLGIIYDRDSNTRAAAFYSSVEGNEFVDSVVVFYPVSDIVSAFDDADTKKLAYAKSVAFCAGNGDVIKILHTEENSFFDYTNVFEYLRVQLNDKAMVDEIERRMNTNSTSVFSLNVEDVSHVMSIGGTGDTGGGMCVVGLYETSHTYSAGYKIVNSILSTMIIIFIILIGLLLYFMINGHITRKKIFDISSMNKELGCYTSSGFQRKAEEILKRNKVTRFAVVISSIRFFNYITEHYGHEESKSLLKYITVVYKKWLTLDEVYGYNADGQFFLLLHYKDEEMLMSRLNKILSAVRKYPKLLQDNYTVKLNFGIYEVDRDIEQSVHNMMDKAIVAKNTMSELGTEQPFKFYNESLRENYVQNADIESRAESALENEEFVVFYQPKLNLKENCIEGAEALVRWYDPDNNIYRSPGTFLPIFEANGFIVRVDRYVYEKVCKYISESIERRQPVYPISVNVSRLTAIQPDFIEFYSKVKNQYHIPDGMLILEFTESFSFERYDVLNDTITQMHRCGFLCSIDDFGSGYSSYNLLKSVNMDEIKMDSLFIRKGLDEERDKIILESVISSAKDLGMKVTQEGVETLDDLAKLKSLGCDVVQGYYYSKPLGLADYIVFLNEHIKK